MKSIVVVMIMFGLLGIARASDQDKFEGLIAKYGNDDSGCVSDTFKPKAACYCTNAGFAYVAGFLIRQKVGGNTFVNCAYPIFDAAGSLTSCGLCDTFQLLTK